MSASEERIARNEALFREFNERVETMAETFDLRSEGDSGAGLCELERARSAEAAACAGDERDLSLER